MEKRQYKGLSLMIIISLLLAGCIGSGTATQYAISGSVKDVDGNGVSGVEIILKRGFRELQIISTDENGKWFATGLRGAVTVEARKTGWTFEKNKIKVTKTNNSVNFIAKFSSSNKLWFSINVKHSFPTSVVESDEKLTASVVKPAELNRKITGQQQFLDSNILDEQIVTFGSSLDIASQINALERAGYEVLDTTEYLNTHLVRKNKAKSQMQTLSTLEGVLSVENNELRYPTWQQSVQTPNDELYPLQRWHYSQIRLPQAWAVTTGDKSVRIAVIDTGVDMTHPDLRANLDLDSALNLTGEIVKYNVNSSFALSSYRDVTDTDGHGTHVAGTIGAVGNNNSGVTGVMWEVEIVPIKIFDTEESNKLVTDAYVVGTSILYAAGLKSVEGHKISEKVDIINLSFGGGAPTQFEQKAIEEAYAEGITLVAASGNLSPTVMFPASHPNVIAVGATDNGGEGIPKRAYYSSAGFELDVVAPGGEINNLVISTYPEYLLPKQEDVPYGGMGGTSMAAPHVSGVIGLMLANDFPRDPDAIRETLHRTSMEIDGRGFSNQVGYGLMNAYWAVNDVQEIKIIQGTREGSTINVVNETPLNLKGGDGVLDLLPGDHRFIAWIDVNGNEIIDVGDYYAESKVISVEKGQSYTFIVDLAEIADEPTDPSDLHTYMGVESSVRVERLH